ASIAHNPMLIKMATGEAEVDDQSEDVAEADTLFGDALRDAETQAEIEEGEFNIFQGVALSAMRSIDESFRKNRRSRKATVDDMIPAVRTGQSYDQYMQQLRQTRDYTLQEIIDYGAMKPESTEFKVAMADYQNRTAVFQVDDESEIRSTAVQIQEADSTRPVYVARLTSEGLSYRPIDQDNAAGSVTISDIQSQKGIVILHPNVKLTVSDASKRQIRDFFKAVGPREFKAVLIAWDSFDNGSFVEDGEEVVFDIVKEYNRLSAFYRRPGINRIKILTSDELQAWFGSDETVDSVFRVVEVNGQRVLIVSQDIANDGDALGELAIKLQVEEARANAI
ncbi:MAG: hypothetical protein K8I00_09440, partial [Candidatus Omnitrophica bacterium]|nr:hypothetical protein [Candidatus Omnitrophota bacterium]